MKALNLIGQKFGRLTVLVRGLSSSGGKARWVCQCICGKLSLVDSNSLISGHTTSCGCFERENLLKIQKMGATRKHGLGNTHVAHSWSGMIQRCYNPKQTFYHNYGGRGVRACEFLRVSPANLFSLLGHREKWMSLDRINPDGHYTCGQCAECLKCGYPMNVRWADYKMQARNKRNNRRIVLNGEEKTMAEWAKIIGICSQSLLYRLRNGIDPFSKKTRVGKPKAGHHA